MRILGGVVADGFTPVLFGVALGLGAAWIAGGAMESLVYGIPDRDPTTLLCVAVVLVGTAAIALVGPAFRASRADPVVALSGE